MRFKTAIFGTIGAMILGLALMAGFMAKNHQKEVVTSAPKGFWRDINETYDGKDILAPAYFCTTRGNYIGHVVNSGSGWWMVYVSDEKKGSYATEEFAKQEVENFAECE